MKLENAKLRNKGFVLIIVLGMVIMLMVILSGFNFQSRTSLYAMENLRKSQQALNCARAGLNVAIAALSSDIDADNQLEKLLSKDSTFTVSGGSCLLTISEESAKLNVSLLKNKDGKLNRIRIDQLLRLIDLLNRQDLTEIRISYHLVPSIIDWTDSDDEVTALAFVKYANSGAESDYYKGLEQPYLCKNGQIDVTEELLLIKGMTPELFNIMYNYITVYGDGKVNINSADKLVVESLSPEIDPVLAKMIIDRRRIKRFENITELREIPGMTDSVYRAIAKTATVSPTQKYYHVTSEGKVGSISRMISATLKRNTETQTVDVLIYKEVRT